MTTFPFLSPGTTERISICSPFNLISVLRCDISFLREPLYPLLCFFPLSSHLSLSLAHRSRSSTVAALLEFIIHESAWAGHPAARCAKEDSSTETLDLGSPESLDACLLKSLRGRRFETQRAWRVRGTAWGRPLHDFMCTGVKVTEPHALWNVNKACARWTSAAHHPSEI